MIWDHSTTFNRFALLNDSHHYQQKWERYIYIYICWRFLSVISSERIVCSGSDSFVIVITIYVLVERISFAGHRCCELKALNCLPIQRVWSDWWKGDRRWHNIIECKRLREIITQFGKEARQGRGGANVWLLSLIRVHRTFIVN